MNNPLLYSAMVKQSSLEALALTTLSTWGSNTDGQLGNGTTADSYFPVDIATGNWKSVIAGGRFALALRDDGKLFIWGSSFGSSPTQAGSSAYVELSNGIPAAIRSDGALVEFGWNSTTSSIRFGAAPGDWKSVTWYGNKFSIRQDGALFQWPGDADYGQIGFGAFFGAPFTPTRVGEDLWSYVATSGLHTMAIRSDEKLFGWGNNSYGQIGIGSFVNQPYPVQIGTSNWNRVSVGIAHTMAIRDDGKLFAWGQNGSFQLGDGTQTLRTSPVQIGTSNWTSVHASGNHTFGIRDDGILFAWGDNQNGQLGVGTTDTVRNPTQISSRRCVAVSGDYEFTVALFSA